MTNRDKAIEDFINKSPSIDLRTDGKSFIEIHQNQRRFLDLIGEIYDKGFNDGFVSQTIENIKNSKN